MPETKVGDWAEQPGEALAARLALQSLLAAMHRDLHELCQPLTALQCQLEVGSVLGDPVSLLEAVEGGLVETNRLFVSIANMRATLSGEDEALAMPLAGRADELVVGSNRGAYGGSGGGSE